MKGATIYVISLNVLLEGLVVKLLELEPLYPRQILLSDIIILLEKLWLALEFWFWNVFPIDIFYGGYVYVILFVI